MSRLALFNILNSLKLYEENGYGGRLKIKFANEHGLKSFITSAQVDNFII